VTVELVPASHFDDDALAALFTAVYAGYWHPIAIDAAALRRMVSTYDLDLEAGVVAVEGGSPVGLGVVAVRGPEAWIGGMGVVPERRGAGLGERITRRLVEGARERAAARVRLEVLEQNAVALGIYRRIGFAPHRDVAVWLLDRPPDAGMAEDADVEETLAELAAELAHVPWQRNPATVANMRALGAPLVAVRTAGGRAVLSTTGAASSLLLLRAETAADAGALLRAPFDRGATSLLWLNGPVEGVAADALQACGATALGRQHELALEL
jgi:ribosomal protein S18 acetylase RimI-like enzyme